MRAVRGTLTWETVRTTVDVVIATWCLGADLPLLLTDRGFEPFVEHLGLRTA